MIFATMLRSRILLVFGMGLLSANAPAVGKIEYNRDIRPILSEDCFACHGPDSAARKAKLRLGRFEDATALREGSDPAIAPGEPRQSELVHRIFARDEADLMPPPKTQKLLTSTLLHHVDGRGRREA